MKRETARAIAEDLLSIWIKLGLCTEDALDTATDIVLNHASIEEQQKIIDDATVELQVATFLMEQLEKAKK